MEAKSLPIMLFDERALTPSFGYVFDPKWLDPFESIVSILWKLARMNRLSGQAITTQLAKSDIDPYEGVAACRSEVDLCRLHLTLGLPLKLVWDSVLPDALQATAGNHFRYCRKCLCRGYHSVVHQVGTNKCCPVHGDPLEIACRTCGAKVPYRLNVALLDAPYRCGNCGHLYGASPPVLPRNKRPFNKKARIAITRLRWSYFAYF
ncbi:TniQ family protein, partial [Duganella fentianensis]